MRTKQTMIGRRRPAFVLVFVVAMLALSVVLLTQLASRSLRESQAAVEAERHLRNRWALTSLRITVLDRAETLLVDRYDRAKSAPADMPSGVSANVMLGGSRYRIVLGNETTKLHLGKLSAERPSAEVREAVRRLVTSRDHLPLVSTFPMSRQSIDHWEMVFVPQGDGRRWARTVQRATERLTLWGEGHLHIRAADDPTLDRLWRSLFGHPTPDEVHSHRRLKPAASLDAILDQADLRPTQLAIARNWLTDRSTTFSLWIEADAANYNRTYFFTSSGAGSAGRQLGGAVW